MRSLRRQRQCQGQERPGEMRNISRSRPVAWFVARVGNKPAISATVV